jgi:hypothetical protein
VPICISITMILSTLAAVSAAGSVLGSTAVVVLDGQDEISRLNADRLAKAANLGAPRASAGGSCHSRGSPERMPVTSYPRTIPPCP